MKAIFKKLLLRKPSAPLVVGLPEEHVLYCIGDIHGRLDLLEVVHQKIAEDSANLSGQKILVYLGDYIDRGPQSCEIVDLLLKDSFPDFQTIYLLGNHEQVMLQFLSGLQNMIAMEWFRFGGLATLMSYGVTLRGIPLAKDLDGLRADLVAKIPQAHMSFYHRLQLNYEIGGYFFVHAGIKPKIKLEKQRAEDMLWIRDEFTESKLFHEKVIVHGHYITPDPVCLPNRIGLDTGAYASGKLSCAVFEGGALRFL